MPTRLQLLFCPQRTADESLESYKDRRKAAQKAFRGSRFSEYVFRSTRTNVDAAKAPGEPGRINIISLGQYRNPEKRSYHMSKKERKAATRTVRRIRAAGFILDEE